MINCDIVDTLNYLPDNNYPHKNPEIIRIMITGFLFYGVFGSGRMSIPRFRNS
ncbi:hypothetical protein M2475_000362 [Breznakia sp. PF5-3]|uniref:hypothetical protein n=1 Tax=unclassified Breznakia TaxID=2623764 RepID=UPI0024060241|nr:MULTISPECIES: hypothetical protein [unclassified Breznakia]MDF9824014.1 hypothetical protein [Breznakia sp. PM6-1]MDF9834813.1 hypothetical protein [Breznakia sp. PF5-3]MDF9838132.1 hypothetical protein [Breznakia sp. PFB2-8]MDF9860118.1 hypothetical protein [Breznakia sp. PH5-24]